MSVEAADRPVRAPRPVRPAPARHRRRRPSSALAWAAATPVLTVLLALVPLVGERDFYFRDDTEIGAFPIWYRLGLLLRAGEWPVLEPSAWMAGNLAAEGQWGLWSPTTLVVSLLASTATSALVFSTGVKLVFLAVAALGVHVLARTYGVRPPLALAAGVVLPFNGFTLYMDAPSWVTGLMTWALLPWAWAALRRATTRGSSPLPFLLVAYLIVSIGYFHGFLALGTTIIAVGVDRLLRRDWRAVRTVVLGGVFCLLLAVTVYLPGVGTAEVTNRSSEVLNTGFLSGDLSSMVAAVSPTAVYGIEAWWGDFTTVPLVYVGWFLPALLFAAPSVVRRTLLELRDALVLGGAAALVILGPSDLGFIRFPVRVTPYLALVLVLVLVVLLDRTVPVRPSRRALAWAVAWGLLGSYLGFAVRPQDLGALPLWSGLGVTVGLVLLWLALRQGPRAAVSTAAVLVLGTAVALAGQLRAYPESPLSHFDLPGQVADYRAPLAGAVNDAIVVGRASKLADEDIATRFDEEDREPRPEDGTAAWREVLLGNAWLVGDASVQNTYTVLQHAVYEDVVCMDYRGETCPGLLTRLFDEQPSTGRLLVDLLSVDTVHIVKDDVPGPVRAVPRPGWRVAHDGPETVTWVRERPVGPAGGVVWTSPGTSVRELSRTDRSVVLDVERTGPGGGRVVLSRLAWPGYEVRGAALGAPVDDYLLTVDVPAGAEGPVTVSFDPPGWTASLACLGAALLLAAGWSLLHLLGRRRRSPERRPEHAADGELERRPALEGELARRR